MVDITELNVSTTTILVFVLLTKVDPKLMLGFVQLPNRKRVMAEDDTNKRKKVDRLLLVILAISRLEVLYCWFQNRNVQSLCTIPSRSGIDIATI
jgi:hypothetical protein